MLKTKIKDFISFPKVVAFLALVVLIGLSLVGPIGAQTFTQGYGADEPLQRGMIVRLKADDASKVIPLTANEIDRMHGVVVSANDASVTLSSEDRKVFVATTGHYDVLVSNENGSIKAGDYITISALSGIGMKAGANQVLVVGKALSDFDGQGNIIASAQVKDTSGKMRTVSLGRVAADIGIARNPLLRSSEANVPGFLRKASESFAGKPVNSTRVYMGVLIFLISTIIAGSLLYSGVHSSIISIGRNPLSKKSILRSLVQIILTSLIIFLSGIFGVYLLLRL